MGGMGGNIGTPVAVTDLEFYGEETNAFLVGSEECTVYKTYRHGRFLFIFYSDSFFILIHFSYLFSFFLS